MEIPDLCFDIYFCWGSFAMVFLRKITWFTLLLLLFVFLFSLPAGASDLARVDFTASDADAEGYFTLSVKISNAEINVFEFALRYDPNTVQPVDSSGNATTNVSKFLLDTLPAAGFLSRASAQIDTSLGLIQCCSYVQPGLSYASAGLEEKTGYANIDADGLVIYTMTFQRIGDDPMLIEPAVKEEGKISVPELDSGIRLLNYGEHLPATYSFVLPESLGESLTVEDPGDSFTEDEEEATYTSISDRLQDTVILQIANNKAAVSGQLMQIDADNAEVTPYIDDNWRSMVPLRFIAESLGAAVAWDGITRSITINQGSKEIKMTVGSTLYTVNGVTHTMDTAPVIVAEWGRTMVPLRFVAEALGMAVEWDASNSLVLVTPPDRVWNLNGEMEQSAVASVLQLFMLSALFG